MKRNANAKGQFGPGNSGRPVGARNVLHGDLINALSDDFKKHGAGVVKIVRAERPVEYLKIIAGVLPKEFMLENTNVLDGMSDEEIAATLASIRKSRLEVPPQESKR